LLIGNHLVTPKSKIYEFAPLRSASGEGA
jgi:hypothetical protein